MHEHDKRWPMYERVLQQAQRMDEMMERLGVDPVLAAREAHGDVMARARAVCTVCPFAQPCGLWLASLSEPQDPPGFCPNRAFFASFRRHNRSREEFLLQED